MSALTGRRRYRIATRLLRRSILVLQVEEAINHCEPIGGTGHYDEWTQMRWRDARPEELLERPLEDRAATA